MNIFNEAPVTRSVSVSAEFTAVVSDRVPFFSQAVQFDADPNSSLISFIACANAEEISGASKKGFSLVFDKNIKSDTYQVGDANFPFNTVDYFETAALPGLITSLQYKPKSGSFSVMSIESSESKLHYTLSYDFKGVNASNEELKIVGKATLIVLLRPL